MFKQFVGQLCCPRGPQQQTSKKASCSGPLCDPAIYFGEIAECFFFPTRLFSMGLNSMQCSFSSTNMIPWFSFILITKFCLNSKRAGSCASAVFDFIVGAWWALDWQKRKFVEQQCSNKVLDSCTQQEALCPSAIYLCLSLRLAHLSSAARLFFHGVQFGIPQCFFESMFPVIPFCSEQ